MPPRCAKWLRSAACSTAATRWAAPSARANVKSCARSPAGTLPLCELDTYELLAMDDDVAFVGLSSGVLQEAIWFGKQALSLHAPVCEPAFDAEPATGIRHLQVHAHRFMSESLWADLLGAEARADAVQLPARPNHLRELVNTWWGYATVQLRHSSFHREMMQLHGSAASAPPAARAASPELDQALQRIDALGMEVEGLKEALRVVLRQTALRQAMALRPEPTPAHA